MSARIRAFRAWIGKEGWRLPCTRPAGSLGWVVRRFEFEFGLCGQLTRAQGWAQQCGTRPALILVPTIVSVLSTITWGFLARLVAERTLPMAGRGRIWKGSLTAFSPALTSHVCPGVTDFCSLDTPPAQTGRRVDSPEGAKDKRAQGCISVPRGPIWERVVDSWP